MRSRVSQLAYRRAEIEIGSSQRKIGCWFRELQHYGFTVLVRHGSLGVEDGELDRIEARRRQAWGKK